MIGTIQEYIRKYPSSGLMVAINMGATDDLIERAYDKAVVAIGKERADKQRQRYYRINGGTDELEADAGEPINGAKW